MNITKHGIILEPTENEFESQAVLNPACILKDGILHMFYRAVKPGNYSTIGYCQLKENKVIYRSKTPVIEMDFAYERHGVEDPRIVEFEGKYYLFYTAYDGTDTSICYATSLDLLSFEKHGVISPRMDPEELKLICERGFQDEDLQDVCDENGLTETIQKKLLWDKDGFIFPRRIEGKIVFVHRLLPSIQLIYCNKLEDLNYRTWKQNIVELDEHTVLDQRYWYESGYIGGGCPPIETPEGWLLIYHAVEEIDGRKIYRVSAALLALSDPTFVIGRLKNPLFGPEENWEKTGIVSDVVFPTGAIIQNEDLYIYYGAADKCIACRSIKLQELLHQLKYDYEHEH